MSFESFFGYQEGSKAVLPWPSLRNSRATEKSLNVRGSVSKVHDWKTNLTDIEVWRPPHEESVHVTQWRDDWMPLYLKPWTGDTHQLDAAVPRHSSQEKHLLRAICYNTHRARYLEDDICKFSAKYINSWQILFRYIAGTALKCLPISPRRLLRIVHPSSPWHRQAATAASCWGPRWWTPAWCTCCTPGSTASWASGSWSGWRTGRCCSSCPWPAAARRPSTRRRSRRGCRSPSGRRRTRGRAGSRPVFLSLGQCSLRVIEMVWGA